MTKNGGGRKSAMRGSMRPGKTNDVPKPPPIPAWFMKQNVTLLASIQDSPYLQQGSSKTIRCVDNETGHVLFTVPHYYPRGSDPALHLDPSDNPSVSSKPDRNRASDSGGALRRDFFDQKFPNSTSTQQSSTESGQWSVCDPHKIDTRDHWALDPISSVFFEVATAARAGLLLPPDARSSSAFATSRIDMHLLCPDPNSHDHLDNFVHDLAQVAQADLIRVDANDFEELLDDYVGQGNDSPGTFSTLGYQVFDGYEATSVDRGKFGSSAEHEEFDIDEDEEDEEEEEDRPNDSSTGHFGGNIEDIRKALYDRRHELSKALKGVGVGAFSIDMSPMRQAKASGPFVPRSMWPSSSQMDNFQWDEARLAALLDSLLDAAKQKRSDGTADAVVDSAAQAARSALWQSHQHAVAGVSSLEDKIGGLGTKADSASRYYRAEPYAWASSTSGVLVTHLLSQSSIKAADVDGRAWRLEWQDAPSRRGRETATIDAKPRTIVHVRDLKDIGRSRLGDVILRRLVKVLQKRRRSGEDILIVGTSAQEGYGSLFASSDHDADGHPFRTIHMPPAFNTPQDDHTQVLVGGHGVPGVLDMPHVPSDQRILEINLRHVQGMLRKLKRSGDALNLIDVKARSHVSGMDGTRWMSEKVLSMDEVQRLAMTAVGLSQGQLQSESVQPMHVALAAVVMRRNDAIAQSWYEHLRNLAETSRAKAEMVRDDLTSEGLPARSKVDRIKKSCNAHESKLLTGVVDAKNIKTGFSDVHAPAETLEALKTLTTLSLLRPEAFKYGVLANDRLPGLLLYGPPGTGKTMLAKAVAKESRSTVLEISGAQIYEKYVGEGEKMVRAVFSLAKKLSPCIVFIDEADAIFGSRSNAGNRNTHREIINQFLREWDGMDDHSVFMMVASNRPFDLDDAVLRRLPRRLLIDLPVAKDRESILSIHLKNEALDGSVSLHKLAEQTPLYSGSDLKNLCVAAALACVREENELAESKKDEKDFQLPEKRTLNATHFEKAITEISASISEDMSSLTAIRKFDEQYGDRKGRRKKTSYGFGATDGVVDETSVRVRQSAPSSP